MREQQAQATRCIDYKNGVYAFDAGYVRPLLAAIHMVVEQGRVALIDTGTNDSLPATLAALAEQGLSPEAVDYVMLTHIHLDHAGGAGLMMQTFPNARLVVHTRGARHMVEPSKLIAGVSAVYGAEYVQKMYGELPPIPAERIVQPADGDVISLAGREIVCLDTPGHARHHLCFFDTTSKSVFSGDMFGLSYRELDVAVNGATKQFIFPTTTPVQFEPDAMHASIDRLMALQPDGIYLTHFSRVNELAAKCATLHRLVTAHTDIALAFAGTGAERHQRIKAGLTDLLRREVTAHGSQIADADLLELFATDLELNAQGLGVWLDAGAKGA